MSSTTRVIFMMLLVVAKTSSAFEISSPEVDQMTHDYHNYNEAKIHNSPILRSLFHNPTLVYGPIESKHVEKQIVRRGSDASDGSPWQPFDCPPCNCSESTTPPPSAGPSQGATSTPLWVFILGMLSMAIFPLLKKLIVHIFHYLKYGRGRTISNGPIVRSASQVLPDVSDDEANELPMLPALSPVPSDVLSTLPIPTPLVTSSCINISRLPDLVERGRRFSNGTPTTKL